MKPWSEMHERDKDALVAEKIFGHSVIREKCPNGEMIINQVGVLLPHYTTDISAAWAVVEKMKLDWIISIWMHNAAGEYEVHIGKGSAYSTSAPKAICRAALRACGIEV